LAALSDELNRGNEEAMSAARDLALFLTGITVADLSPQTLDHAAMLIASTLVVRNSTALVHE